MFGNQIRCSQTGSGRLKAIIWTAILASFVYVCVQVVPIYMADFEFRDTMQTAARFASVGRSSPDDIRQDLFKQAQKADMPIRLEDIKVDSHNGHINIEANYSVTVDLHVYQWTLNFHPSVSNDRLL
jgi:predicted membrane protein